MALRPESSVSVGKNVDGELVFSCDCSGPVVHRTPEELGIPRVIADTPPARALPHLWPHWNDGPPPKTSVKKDAPVRYAGAGLNAPATERRKRMANAALADERDQRKKNRIPSKRYGRPAVSVVKMDEVPAPPAATLCVADELYTQICGLCAGVALSATFDSEGHGDYVRGRLRAKAKKAGKFMSSSRSEDGKTRYFWIEEVESDHVGL